jgi:hypothetical protein
MTKAPIVLIRRTIYAEMMLQEDEEYQVAIPDKDWASI